ncbi:MAG: hypothetical protein OXM55_06920 [Bdellovibrionales bacterium]|nr:hypothetical protein [Bdellovibrionales bacterium]
MKIIFINWFIFIYSSLFVLVPYAYSSCKVLTEDNCPILENFQVFNKNTQVHFNHLCSELAYDTEFAKQSFVFFEKSGTSPAKALVLAHLRVGWLGINKLRGIAVDFMEIKVESLWPQASISLALEVKDTQTGHIMRGEFVSHYLKGPHSQVNYQLDEHGNMNWHDFTELGEETTTELRNHPVPAPSIIIGEWIHLSWFNLVVKYELSLIIKNDNTAKEIKLAGPPIKNMDFFLDIEKPKVETLGFFDTLNPFQKGSFWDQLYYGFKYDKCIDARKKARIEFIKTFNRM